MRVNCSCLTLDDFSNTVLYYAVIVCMKTHTVMVKKVNEDSRIHEKCKGTHKISLNLRSFPFLFGGYVNR